VVASWLTVGEFPHELIDEDRIHSYIASGIRTRCAASTRSAGGATGSSRCTSSTGSAQSVRLRLNPARARLCHSLGPVGHTGAMKFRATVELGGKTATGIAVPDEVVAALNAGRRPAVKITLGAHTYRTTVASMGGRFFVPLNATHREAAGVAAGDQTDVLIELDTAPREVELPYDLSEALAGDECACRFFEQLSFTHRKEWVRWITDAKKTETRLARIDKTLAALRAGQRTR
jgi:hypothetical protein